MSGDSRGRKPQVSVVVVVYNMAREAPRTLLSLSASYQRHIAASDYEVIVVDNGSWPPFDAKIFDRLDGNFRLIRIDPAPPSPARAINRGLAEARGEVVGVMIDGARLATPGLLHFANQGARLYPCAVVATLGWYLGFDHQRWSVKGHYDRKREDALLASIGWRDDGYRLFDISTPDESSVDGWFNAIAESNALFMRREHWDALGGVEEQFDAPGGGFLNLDTLIRAVELPSSELVVLLGEATFHQLHGGVATNANVEGAGGRIGQWRAQYETIRRRPWATPTKQNRTYLGQLPQPALLHFARAIVEPVNEAPLGRNFNAALWSCTPSSRPADAVAAALLGLAENELRARRFEAAVAVARIARRHAPDEPGPQRLLSIASGWLRGASLPPDERRAGYHLARAKAHRLIGEAATAASEYRMALGFAPDLTEAQTGLCTLRWPGEDYLTWLARLHEAKAPKIYLEIGVGRGHSLALARPPTCAIGVDPSPNVESPFSAETHIYCETSNAFFARPASSLPLDGRTIDLAFIDGMHLFEQALRDFINVEKHSRPDTIVLLHDTVPFDEITQRRKRSGKFYTGDVWKMVLCLMHYRRDLDVFTVGTAPTGLTVISGLDPQSNLLDERYDEAVARFIDTPYSEIAGRDVAALNIVDNDWAQVKARLKLGSGGAPLGGAPAHLARWGIASSWR